MDSGRQGVPVSRHPREELSAYADGELDRESARRVEEHLRGCTECVRELALIRLMGGAMRSLGATPPPPGVWEGVERRIARPVGWLLFVAGLVLWVGLALVAWFRESLTLEWLAATAIGAGLVVLALFVAYEQYREWKGSPYKDLER